MISIVVCTRDRAARLERCLRQLCETRLDDGVAWQVVVVDNASTDATKSIVDGFATCLPLAYVYEPNRGLSYARNRGIDRARHIIVAFTDDDCLVAPDWAQEIVTHFAQRPEVSVIGGRVELADADDSPVSIRTHDRGEDVTTAEQVLSWMSGCNMAFRREVFDRAGLFDPAFGKGRRIGSAEDLDLLYRALKHGARMTYAPSVVVRHAHGRSDAAALVALARDYVRGRGAFYGKHIGDGPIARMAYWEVRRLLSQLLDRDAGPGAREALRELAAGACMHFADGMRTTASRVSRSTG
jgi:glycosyltransferase involved in cell wall biosynthesis